MTITARLFYAALYFIGLFMIVDFQGLPRYVGTALMSFALFSLIELSAKRNA